MIMFKKIKNLKINFLLFIAVFILSACGPSTPPEEITHIYFTYMTTFEHQRAYDFLSKNQKNMLKNKKINRESYFGYFKPPIGNPLWMGIDFKITGQKIDENGPAQVKFQLTDVQSKQTAGGECRLVIENREWKVNDVIFYELSEEREDTALYSS